MYFTRPNDDVELRALADASARVADAVARAPAGKYAPGVTAKEWLTRRIRAQRMANYKVSLSWVLWY